MGDEEGKGNELTREAFEQLRGSSLNFIGNVEGRDIYNGRCDVVVTDGFTGNVCLKVSESLAEMLTAMIREELGRDVVSMAGAALSRRAFERMKKRVDYTEMGGAPLLGINGASIICHGASPVKAIKNGVRVAAEWVRNDVNEHIKTALEAEAVLAEGREGRARMKRAQIVGVGAYAPQRIVTNADSRSWSIPRTSGSSSEREFASGTSSTTTRHLGSRPPRGPPGARSGGRRAGGGRPHRRRHDHRRHAASHHRQSPPAPLGCRTRARWTCTPPVPGRCTA